MQQKHFAKQSRQVWVSRDPDLDNTNVANLINFAENSNDTAGVQAKRIVENAFGYHFYNCIYTDESDLKKRQAFQPVLP
jgi:hypothetical protein